jgi:Tol biopolymer transport system component
MKFLSFVVSIILMSAAILYQNISVAEAPPATNPALLEKVQSEPNQLLSSVKQLTFAGKKTGEGYFSADGQKMVFQSDREAGNPFYQIYLMDLKSGQTDLISTGSGKTTCAWIHPKKQKILFSSTHLDPEFKTKVQAEYESQKSTTKQKYAWSYDETFEIFVQDFQKSGAKVSKPVQLTHELGYDAEGSFSPDGQNIVFASNRTGFTEKLNEEEAKLFKQDASYMMEIYTMKADGSQVKRLTNSRGYDGGPFYSADGKKITWRRFNASGQIAEIYVMNADGTDQKAITQLTSMSWAPFFHPSGDYIIFTTNIHGYSNFELYIVDAKGEHKPVRVSFIDGFDGLPVFSPDGQKLSWTHKNEKGESQIYIGEWNDLLARKLLDLPAAGLTQMKPEIDEADLKKQIAYFSSNQFKGRKAGSAEEVNYTQEVEKYFKQIGLKPWLKNGTYFQGLEFTTGLILGEKNSATLSLKKDDQSLKIGEDYLPLSLSKSGKFQRTNLVFAGYGIKAPASEKFPAYDSYAHLDVAGKWVLMLRDLPMLNNPEYRQYLSLYSRSVHKLTLAKNRGALGVILISPTALNSIQQLKFDGALVDSELAALSISEKTAQKIFKAEGWDLKKVQAQLDENSGQEFLTEMKNAQIEAMVDLNYQKSHGRNVLAYLPVKGAQKTLLIGAHIDHLGMGDTGTSLADKLPAIHGGADDNGSGIAGILELAHYFSKHPEKLKYNLAFALWTGEEIGLIGSNYFVKNYKTEVSPLHGKVASLKEDVVAYLNMDMIGRLRDSLIIQGVGSAKGWKDLFEKNALQTSVAVSLQEDPYQPTDSMALYLGEIPSINFFTGAHAEYHTPKDTFELINFKGLNSVLNFIKDTVVTIQAGKKAPLEYQKTEGGMKKMENRTFRVYLGTIPDYSQEGVKGVRISGVTQNGPSEKAGIKGGDVIVELDKMKVNNLYDYVYVLQSMKPQVKTTIKVLRNGDVKELEITPLLKE